MRKILIIKIGELGDVLRTTPLLRKLHGNVTWITGRQALPLLAGNPYIARLLTPGGCAKIRRERFDWVINFDEDRRAGKIASSAKAARKTGVQFSAGKFTYCENSAPWFDMSLISRLGLREADRLKYRSRKTYQHYLFKACGFRFNGEEYMLPAAYPEITRPLVAVERRTGLRWPLKHWRGYGDLTGLFKKTGIDFFILRQRKSLREYISDINRCAVLVSGDTLAMHIALALRKRAVAIFNCTSPWEIHGYARLRKIVHSRLHEFFYSTAGRSRDFKEIGADTVFNAVTGALAQSGLRLRRRK